MSAPLPKSSPSSTRSLSALVAHARSLPPKVLTVHVLALLFAFSVTAIALAGSIEFLRAPWWAVLTWWLISSSGLPRIGKVKVYWAPPMFSRLMNLGFFMMASVHYLRVDTPFSGLYSFVCVAGSIAMALVTLLILLGRQHTLPPEVRQ